MFSRFYFPRTGTIFFTVSRNIVVTDYFFVYSYFFQCEEKNWENFLGYGNNAVEMETTAIYDDKTKGQLISEWLFGVFNVPKKTQKFDEFLP